MAKAQGVVGIFTDNQGRVICSVNDFDRDGYGGFSLQEAQRHRVKARLAIEIVRSYCSDMILPAIENYDARQIMGRLVQKGATVTYIPIGHEPTQGAPGDE